MPLVDQGIRMPPKHISPSFKLKAFTCVHSDCQTLSTMGWTAVSGNLGSGWESFPLWVCRCNHCRKISVWGTNSDESAGILIVPATLSSPDAHENLPEDCRRDFEEARQICSKSPRGAAAILRLCLQKLLVHLGGKGEHIDTDIKTLVTLGLDPHIQQALDVIRVTGNNAVHPLEMNLEDDHDSVLVLFEMINFIVEERISRPQKTQSRFANLPEKARVAIEKRDRPRA